MRRAPFLGMQLLLSLVLVAPAAAGSDWPTYLHDRTRSGATDAKLKVPLVWRWTFRPVAPPDPAWTLPVKEVARVRFDDAYHVVAGKNRVYFGSSGDNKVYCLDATSGKVVWSFFTEGPVRLAPTLWKGRVYFGSDDGFAYCVQADTGRLVWKQRAAYGKDKAIGHGRVVSVWPVRTGVLVDHGVAYFGAGIFPSESIYICAANADDGTILWRNDTAGERGPEQARDGISPQGYLLASEENLYVPSGRNMPAAFDRATGRFRFYLGGGKSGGTYAILADNHLVAGVNEQRVYDSKTGKRWNGKAQGEEAGYAWSPANRLIVTQRISYSLTDHEMLALDRTRYPVVAKERSKVVAERDKLEKDVRSAYRTRYRLDKADPKFEEKRKEWTRKIDAFLAQIKAKGKALKEIEDKSFKWKRDNDCRDAMILAGDVLLAGGEKRVIAVDADSGKWRWTGTVDGRASGLAVAGGQLYVSTTTGAIYCFAPGKPAHVRSLITPAVVQNPYERDAASAAYKKAAEQIIADTGITKGFCLVLGSDEGRLALALARRTDLQIYGVESDPEKVARARKAIDAAGLYGTRVTIDHGSLHDLPYPDYFANLIVSDRLLREGKLDASPEEVFRVLKPFGGVAYLGQPAEAANGSHPVEAAQLTDWWKASKAPTPEIHREGGLWAVVRRGELPGAGAWTHLYGNTANTNNSDDHRVQTPMGILWFGRPGPERMVERHARAAGPVSLNGRIFIQGENIIMAHDAYNGVQLWQREIPGAVRVRVDVDGSNLALSEQGLFVAARDEVLRLDPATGETLRTYKVHVPDGSGPRRWGWLATVDKTVYGTSAKPLLEAYGARWQNPSEDPIENAKAYGRFFTGGGDWRYMQAWPDWGREDTWKGGVTGRMFAGNSIFARDIDTGKLRWAHTGTIGHCTISIADGVLYYADSDVTAEQKKQAVLARREKYGKLTYEDDGAAPDGKDYDVRRVVAVDAVTGKKRWDRIVDLTGCGGDRLGTAYDDGLLLVFGHFSNHDGSAWSKGQLRWRRVTVLSAEDGSDIWSRELNYLRRPLVVGEELIVEPRAVDIRSGEWMTRYHPISGKMVPWEFKRGGHSCGITTASAYCFFLRSASINYYDFQKDEGMLPIGGMRAGCWVNMIPANGLMMIPEASAGCTCSFPVRSTVVMAPKKKARKWTVYVAPDEIRPVRHWYINLGAPGDRKDAEGNVWFGYPRLHLGYGVRFDLHEKILKGLGYFAHSDEGLAVRNSDRPWVHSSGVRGLLKCTIPLVKRGEPPEGYTVRLDFCEPFHERVGKRRFDIKLQGEVVAEDFDIFQAAGGKNVAVVKEFRDIPVADDLTIEFVPSRESADPTEAPLLNGIAILRQAG